MRGPVLALALLIGGCVPPSPAAPLHASDPAVHATPAAKPAPSVRPSSGSRTPVLPGPERLAFATALERPPQPPIAARYEAALIADYCVDRDVPAPPAGDVVLTLLDRTYALPSDYVPADLVPASDAGLTGTSGTKLVRSVLVEDLAAMRAAWEAAGLAVILESAYRSYGMQASTFDSWTARLGYPEALVRSARPGHSEHQLGTAIDVTSPGWGGRFGDWARETAEGAWMAAHAWEYGFVMSYPSGSHAQTCFGYEPWHYRWIGREAAAAHRASGLYLRQFLERHVGG